MLKSQDDYDGVLDQYILDVLDVFKEKYSIVSPFFYTSSSLSFPWTNVDELFSCMNNQSISQSVYRYI